MKIGILGCAGRMGRALVQEVRATAGAELGGGMEPTGPAIGQDLGTLAGGEPLGVKVVSDAATLFSTCDCVIDFTIASVVNAHVKLAAENKKTLVLGTTGLGDAARIAIAEGAKKTVIVQAANFSVGVNLLLGLTEKVASMLGPDFDIDILEMHHRHKVDAPSGTALALGEAAAKGRAVNLKDVGRRTRDGLVGARPSGEIGFATLRGGDVIGDHTVIFAADGERIELTHKASGRPIFARGAVRAALWTVGKGPGLYSMRDVLGL